MDKDTITPAAAKMGAAIGGLALGNLTLNEWVMVATLVYVILQTVLLAPKFRDWLWPKEPKK